MNKPESAMESKLNLLVKRVLNMTARHLMRADDSFTLSRHPLEVRPAGNALEANVNLRAALGPLDHLPDELLDHILSHLDGPSLVHLGATCKAFYAYARGEELWKIRLIE